MTQEKKKRTLKRKFSKYVTFVVGTYPDCEVILARMPENHMVWRELVKKMGLVPLHYGYQKGKISVIEELCDDRAAESHWGKSEPLTRNEQYYEDQRLMLLPKAEAAFAGDSKRFTNLHLWAWDEERGEFTLVRDALEKTPEDPLMTALFGPSKK